MPLDKPLEEITESDLQALISDGEREGRSIDYKLETYGGAEQHKQELCYDVTSFANTVGGHIVIGIEEVDGLPTEVKGLSGIKVDAEMLRLQQIIRSGTQPKLSSVHFHPVPLDNGNVCIIIRIPRSWARPHAATNNHSMRFYARTANGKNPLDVPEVKAAFLQSETTADRIRAFRIDRLAAIESGETPVEFPEGIRCVFHMIPIDAFDVQSNVNLSRLVETSAGQLFKKAPFARYNFEGVLFFERLGPLENLTHNGYVQIYSEGIIEGVFGNLHGKEYSNAVNGLKLEQEIIDYLRELRSALKILSASFPVILFVTILGMNGKTLHTRFDNANMFGVQPIDSDSLRFADVVLQDEDISNHDLLKSIFDRLWRAAGRQASPSYDANGQWSEEARKQAWSSIF